MTAPGNRPSYPGEQLGMYSYGLHEVTAEANRPIVEDVLGRWIPPETDMLEIGCGIGALYGQVPMTYRPGYTGLELIPQFIDLHNQAHPEARVIQGDARDLPFENQSLSAIVAKNLLDVVEDPKKVIKEVKRTLKPGGVFVHLHDVRPNMGFCARQLPLNLIPFPHFDDIGLMIRFQMLPVAEYHRLKLGLELDQYVHQVRTNFNLLESMSRSVWANMDRKVKANFSGKLVLSNTFREIFNSAVADFAVDRNLVVEEQDSYNGTAILQPEHIDNLIAVDPRISILKEMGGTLISDENSGVRYLPPFTDDNQATIVSSMSSIVLSRRN